uniref:Uncharacterized protein n=1 Tax=Zooxanthella nutricula TaxID=1333877 RepID=A0A7S2JDL4_9DINO
MRQWPMFPMRILPGKLNGAWHTRVGDKGYLGVAMPLAIREETAPAASSASSSGVKVLSGQALKVKALSETAHLMLETFMGVQTTLPTRKTMEKDFTPLVTRFLKAKQDLVDSGADESLLTQTTDILNVVSAAKKIVRPLNEFMKSNKRATLLSMRDSLVCVGAWHAQLDEPFTLSTELASTLTKSDFFHLHSSEDASSAMRSFDTEAMKKWSQNMNASEPNSPEKVMHSCIMSVISEALQRKVPDQEDNAWQACKATLLTNGKAYLEAIESLLASWPALKDTREVLAAYVLLVRAASQDATVSPKQADESKKLLDEHGHARIIKESLKFKGIGLALAADSDAVVLKSEMDAEVNEDFGQHCDAIFTEGMPTGDPADDTIGLVYSLTCAWELFNVSGAGCEAAKLLSESLEGLVVGVVQKWSQARLAEEADSFKAIIQHVAHCIVCFDWARGCYVSSTWRRVFEEWDAVAASGPETFMATPEIYEHIKDDGLPSEECFQSVVDQTEKFCEALSTVIKFENDMSHEKMLFDNAKEAWKNNKIERDVVWSMATGLKRIMGEAIAPTTCLAEFMDSDEANDFTLLEEVLIATKMMKGSHEYKKHDYMITFTSTDEEWHDGMTEDVDAFFASVHQHVTPLAVQKHVLRPILDIAADDFLTKCMAIKMANLRMSDAEWNKENPLATIRLFWKGDFSAPAKELMDYVLPAVLETAVEDPDKACVEVLASMDSWRALSAFSGIIDAMASPGGSKLTVPNWCEEPTPLATLNSSVTVFVMAETILCMTAWLAYVTVEMANEKEGERMEGLYSLIGVAFKNLDMRLKNEWPTMVDNLLMSAEFNHLSHDFRNIARHVGHIKLLLPALASVCEAAVLKRLHDRYEGLLAILPRHDHIISKNTYNGHLARTQLLGCPNRAKIGDLTSALENANDSTTEIITNLRNITAAGTDDAFDPESIAELAACKSALDVADYTTFLIAAVNAVEEFGKTAKGRDMSKVLLTKGHAAPEALKKRLETLAASG